MNWFTNAPSAWKMVMEQLQLAFHAQRFPQVLLLEGCVGIGKRKLAQDIAQALVCEQNEVALKPCGHCFSCKFMMDSGATRQWVIPLETKDRETPQKISEATQKVLEKQLQNPYDLQLISITAITNVEQIRLLRDVIQLKADHTRVFILTDIERMNDNAANALLKTLEEVPTSTYFLLTTSARHQVLRTILSRSLPITLPGLEDAVIAQEMAKLDIPCNADILGYAQGSVGRALVAQSMGIEKGMGHTERFLKLLLKGLWSPLMTELESWGGKDVEQVLFHLEVLAIALQDMQRLRAGLSVRLPSLTLDLPEIVNAEATQKMVGICTEATYRIQQKRGNIIAPLSWMAISMGEVLHVR